MSEDRIVNTKRKVAQHFGVTWQAVNAWCKRGMPRMEGKLYNLDAIEIWRASSVQMRKADENREQRLKKDVMVLRMNTKMSVPDIADKLGLTQHKTKTITDMVDKYKPQLEEFKANKADYFALEQIRYHDHITDAKLRGTGARDLAGMAKMAWEKERVERGESTDNVAIIVKHIMELKQSEDADQG